MKIHVINGPNLNLLGERQPEIYGKMKLEELNEQLSSYALRKDIFLSFFQSNHEGFLIDELHRVRKTHSGVIFNPGGYTHTSIALRDAIASIPIPVIEVHLSNLLEREDFRKKSFIRDVCKTHFMGEGMGSYIKAIDFFKESY